MTTKTVTCECGCIVCPSFYKRHLLTKKHAKKIEKKRRFLETHPKMYFQFPSDAQDADDMFFSIIDYFAEEIQEDYNTDESITRKEWMDNMCDKIHDNLDKRVMMLTNKELKAVFSYKDQLTALLEYNREYGISLDDLRGDNDLEKTDHLKRSLAYCIISEVLRDGFKFEDEDENE